jgi:membrane associated rhomboid family serine protease
MSIEQFKPRGFNFLPPVVKNLLIINGLFFLASFTFGSLYNKDLAEYLGLHYFESELFKPWQYVTYMFMHSTISFNHILFNMFALWMFGYSLENYWGGKKFLFYYLVTGIGAAIVQTFVTWIEISSLKDAAIAYRGVASPDEFAAFIQNHFSGRFNADGVQKFVSEWSSDPGNIVYIQDSFNIINSFITSTMNIPTVGASGAVFGILLAFGMTFPNQLIYIYFLFPIKAKWFVIIYGAAELIFGMTNTQSNVAHFAHLGGMLFGFFLIRLWKKNNMHHNF